ncbi:MAG: SDR family oxidoreductase [Halobacteriales archaeon]|nr:SDR family oxidoreductase [Halobacteriales archaeon]
MHKPVVLVTGTSSGIGREAVPRLARAGALVVATARDAARIADLAAPGSVETLALDVADPASRAAAVEAVLARHGRIDALVNNAGYGAILSVEDTSAAALRAMHETNVVGPHELARLVLPAMRRQGSGRIVNVSSIAGHVAVPLLGAYCSTKFALRALTQAMDIEVRRFGVRALLIEPGVIRTGFGARTLAETQAAHLPPDGPYAPLYGRWMARRSLERGAHPRVVARRIVAACLSQHPRLHSFTPLDAKAANLAKRWLPDSWIGAGMRLYFR